MKHHVYQFIRYGIIGLGNTALSLLVFNFCLFVSGITSGPWVTFFSFVTFTIVITQSFFWNKFLVFQTRDPVAAHRQYTRFFLVSGTVALVNVGIISFLVNVVGSPVGINEHVWANIAVLITIPVAVLGNFSGYKFLVFADKAPKV